MVRSYVEGKKNKVLYFALRDCRIWVHCDILSIEFYLIIHLIAFNPSCYDMILSNCQKCKAAQPVYQDE